jgi:titin
MWFSRMINWLRPMSNSSPSHRSTPSRIRRYQPSVERLEGRALLSIVTVTSNADSGPGSLRQALMDAYSGPAPDIVNFDLQGSTTIKLLSPIFGVSGPLVIDGTSQPGYAGHPLVVLDGSGAGNNNGYGVIGLNILGNVTVRGLAIDNFSGPGIEIYTNVYVYNQPAVITGCYIGTDATGTTPAGNYAGIEIINGGAIIGGPAPGAGNLIIYNHTEGIQVGGDAPASTITGNVISRNGNGILLGGSGTVVQGNFIGTDATGSTAFGNNTNGIVIEAPNNTIGGTAAGAGNVISGNTLYGIELPVNDSFSPTGNLIQGNDIGTNAAGTAALPNFDGVAINGFSNNTIGGATAGAGNLISGNKNDGLVLIATAGRATGNVIQGNSIGTGATGSTALPNLNGVVINGVSANTIGGAAAGTGNLISGNTNDGVTIVGGPNGGSQNAVLGNRIGTDQLGDAALPNYLGVVVNGAADNTIGQSGAGNLISGNCSDGVELLGALANDNQVVGNSIGTNLAGDVAVPNLAGVVVNGAAANTIGQVGARNLISGNTTFGVELVGAGATRNVVQGNSIGTDTTGTAALSNDIGVLVSGAAGNAIGEAQAGTGNLISGNHQYGIELANAGTSSNQVLNNTIGTDAAGTSALANYDGILVKSAPNNIIGLAGAGNVISGNSQYGLVIVGAGATGNQVQSNFVGTDETGNAALPNVIGIVINNIGNNTVGGTTAATRNLISGNTSYGLELVNAGASFNTVEGNYIGVNAAGSAALSNSIGILIVSAPSNTIGGTQPGAGNLISGNFWYGVQVNGAIGNFIWGNVIGLSANRSFALSSKVGVCLQQASNNIVGGMESGAGNIIAENGWGVRVNGGTENTILGNSIFGNTVLGIQLLNGGNANIPAPVLSAATNPGGTTTVSGTVLARPSTIYTIEFFWTPAHYATGAAVQGKTLVGYVQIVTDLSGSATFSIPLTQLIPIGDFVTVTATDPNGNTSPFSNGVQVQ